MNKAKIFAACVSLLGLVGLMYVLAGGADISLVQLPFEALTGGAFFFAWGFGVPLGLSYLLTLACVFGVLWLGFTLGYRLWRGIFKHS